MRLSARRTIRARPGDISTIKGFEVDNNESTASYLEAVLAAAKEADAAGESPETAVAYLGSRSEALVEVNKAGTALGIQDCQIDLEPSS